jgi:hypothetical protein
MWIVSFTERVNGKSRRLTKRDESETIGEEFLSRFLPLFRVHFHANSISKRPFTRGALFT